MELQDQVLGWLSPIDLSRFSRTAKRYAPLVKSHWNAAFKFYNVVWPIFHYFESRKLQHLLDSTGSFIWGAAAYQFFAREAINWEDLGLPSVHEPIDIDIFVNFLHLPIFLEFLREDGCGPDYFQYDAEYIPEMGETFQQAMLWLNKQAPDSWGRDKQSVVGVLRFTRLLWAKTTPRVQTMSTVGVRMIVTRRSPWESVLMAKTSGWFIPFLLLY